MRGPLIWLYAALLVLWGNASSPLLGASAWLPGGSWQWVLAGVVLILISLAVARAAGLDAAALGMRGTKDALRGAAIGLLVGGAAGAVAVGALTLVAPLILGRVVDYAPLASVTEVELQRHIGIFLPLGDILPEELAFRGVLLGALLARGARYAVLVSSAVFALWHVVVVLITVGDTTLAAPSGWFGVAVAGALLAVLIGGAIVAWLRLRTGSLLTTIAAHWAFNAALLAGLWSTRSPAPSGCC